MLTPDDYLSEALDWTGHGDQTVGGCCGVPRDRIRALEAGLPARARAPF